MMKHLAIFRSSRDIPGFLGTRMRLLFGRKSSLGGATLEIEDQATDDTTTTRLKSMIVPADQ